MIEIPDSKDEIERAVRLLNEQPDRLARAGTLNVVNSPLRHDCLYGWKWILQVAGLAEHPATTYRVAALANLAVQVAQPSSVMRQMLPRNVAGAS